MSETALRSPAHRDPLRSLPLLLAGLCALAVVALPAATAGAQTTPRFQLGARGTAQVGAFVARADDPHAVFYNPAALVHLDGLQVALDVDRTDVEPEWAGGFGFGPEESDTDSELLPGGFVTWHRTDARWAVGLGVSTVVDHRVGWSRILGLNNQVAGNELELLEVHPVFAWRVDEHWSVGGGLLYLDGDTAWRFNQVAIVSLDGSPETSFPFFYQAEAATGLDGYGWDLGVQYQQPSWGLGFRLRNTLSLEGSGTLAVPGPDDPRVLDLDVDLDRGRPRAFETTVDLPIQLDGGVWLAVTPRLRVEADLAWTAWSDAEQTFDGHWIYLGGTSWRRESRDFMAGWDDTLSVRVAAEGDLVDRFVLSGGVAWEPSPVPDGELAPAWPRGDAFVYGLGLGYRGERLGIDLGVSTHDGDAIDLGGDPRFDSVVGDLTTDARLLSLSLRYGF